MWTVEAVETYLALTGSSMVNLLRGSEVMAMRDEIRRLMKGEISNEDYVAWRNAKLVEILNARVEDT